MKSQVSNKEESTFYKKSNSALATPSSQNEDVAKLYQKMKSVNFNIGSATDRKINDKPNDFKSPTFKGPLPERYNQEESTY